MTDTAPRPTAQTLKAAASYFGLVFGAGFVLGMIRVLLVAPRVGERAAELLEMPFMLAVVIVAARLVERRFALARSVGVRVRVGAVALALLLAAELLLAVVLSGRSLADYVASRDPVAGGAYVAALAVYAAMPSILLLWKDPTKSGTDFLQALAVLLAMGIVGLIAQKGHADVTALAQKYSGMELWVRLARYVIANIAS